MATLLLRLAAPLQAWAADSKFETRKTGREPTKSGVIGLLAAALGLRRDEREALLRLTGLRFGVRVEREGQLLVDYHTAKTQDEKTSYVTYRHYLQDAVFLAGIESTDTALLQQLQQALLHPAFPLYLGRRCCPPTLPLCLGVRPGSLQEVLQAEPPLCPGRQSRILLDADPLEPGTAPQRDVPVSFDPHHRQYGYRSVRELWQKVLDSPETMEHDPFRELKKGGERMYLSRVELDPTRRSTMAALSAPQKLHGAVESAFAGERRRRLWRLDRLGERLYLLLLSEDAPELSGVVEQFGTGAAAETRSYDPLLQRVEPGSCWQFRLTANPTKCCKDPKAPAERGTVAAHCSTKYQKQWLLDRAAKHGFALREEEFTVTRVQWQHFAKHGIRPVTLLAVTYEGVLRVTDPEQFRALLCQGMGRGKAYGLGLMTVMRGGN